MDGHAIKLTLSFGRQFVQHHAMGVWGGRDRHKETAPASAQQRVAEAEGLNSTDHLGHLKMNGIRAGRKLT